MSERSPSPQRAAYLRAQRRRRRLVLALQILLLVAFLGWWELSARLGWVDAFKRRSARCSSSGSARAQSRSSP